VLRFLESLRRRVGFRTWRRFTQVVPLGVSCRVTYQVRTFFGSTEAYPFDWWISPAEGLARYLERPDPDLIYKNGGLEEMRGAQGEVAAIRSTEFGFQLFHEFPRHRERLPGREEEVSVVSPGWQGYVAASAARHAGRLARLRSLDRVGNRILFVRHRLDIPYDNPADPGPAVERLWRALCGQYREARIALLLVNFRIPETPSRRVLAIDFDDPQGPLPEAWRGETERWAAAFSSLGLTSPGPPPGGPPGPD
jgi:hypothetical protein